MKTATYHDLKGNPIEVTYDENAPCWCCGLPVGEASMSGTVICPWCDCGRTRDGRQLTMEETVKRSENYKQNLDATKSKEQPDKE